MRKVFFPKLLDDFSGEAFLKRVWARYHFEGVQLGELQAVAGEMLPLMRSEAFWEVCAPWTWGEEEKGGVTYEGVLMTLGEGLDRLQESYQEKGMLLECYMIEALAGELLLQAYRAYELYVGETHERFVAGYHFPGSEEKLPLETLPGMLHRFSGRVSCNESFFMQPKKSVFFLAELTRDADAKCEGICAGCGSRCCPNRMDGLCAS